VNLRLIALIAASGSAAAPGAQRPASIDFQRDVQPIFREHCISCHGPDQQMNGLRWIGAPTPCAAGRKRTSGQAMRRQPSVSRLVGTTFGLQMPPAAPLNAGQIETIKQ